jgi:CMD domain protein
VSSSTTKTPDVVDSVLGITPGSPLALLRGQKPELVAELQAYYEAVFEPDAESAKAFAPDDRYLVAVRVASHTSSKGVADWYANLAEQAGVDSATIARTRDVGRPWKDATRLGAAIRHADLLTLHPADAQASDLQDLKAAEFTAAGILSLSQVIAFVSYQVRFIAGLRTFGAQ